MRTALWPREVQLFEAYLDWLDGDEAARLEESAASTDFPSYLAAILNKRMMQTYNEAPSIWRRYTSGYDVPDFKPQSFYGLTELSDLVEVLEGEDYKDQAVRERVGATITVKTYGRSFSITRKALINDDMGQLRDHPGRQGRAAGRSIARSVVSTLTGNGNAYDGVALFHANHANLTTTALSEAALGAMALLLNQQTDDNANPIELSPYLLVIGAADELTARRILNSSEIHQPGSGTTAAYGLGDENVMRGYVPYAVERYFTDPNNYYLFANPQEAPVVGVGFLQGNRNPAIFLFDPGMRSVLGGGADPYTMEFDEMKWKCRYDWGTAILDWRGAIAAIVP